MRAVLVAILGATIVSVAAACGGGHSPTTYPINVYVDGKPIVSVPLGHKASFLPLPIRISRGYAQDVVHIDPTVATRLVDRGLARRAGRVDLPFTPVSSLVPITAQRAIYHHGSEIAALSMLLSAARIDAGEPGLRKLLPRSGPADPVILGSGARRWGDPELGFVGHLNGSGTRAFGVYQQPIQKVAKHYGVRLKDVSGESVAAIRAELLNGHPLIAWVGDSTAGSSSWLTPSGKKITVNLGEEAIVLVGAGPGYFLVNDPLTGKRLSWSTSRFSTRWALIGSRALELP